MPKINKQLREVAYGDETKTLSKRPKRELKVVTIKSPFDKSDRSVEVIDYRHGDTLLDLRNKHFPKNVPVVVSLNGKIMMPETLHLCYPLEGDELLFVPELQGGDNNSTLRTIAMVVVAAVVLWFTAGAAAGAFGGYFATTVGGVSTLNFAGALAATALAVGGAMLVNAILPLETAKLESSEDSSTQSWSPATTQAQGGMVPKFYGVNKLYGNIISSYTETATNSDGKEENYINALICLGLGPYKNIYDYKLCDQYVNKTEEYDGLEDVTVHYDNTLGMMDQTCPQGFNETKTEYQMAVKVTSTNPHSYTTQGESFDKLEVVLTFPYGLWYTDSDDGDRHGLSVNVRVKVRPHGTTEWTTITYETPGHWVQRYQDPQTQEWVTAYSYENRTDPNQYTEGERGGYYAPGMTDEGAGPGISAYTYWHWETTPTLDYIIVKGDQTSSLTRTISYEVPTKGKYDIYVENLSSDYTDDNHGDDMYLSMVREVYYDDFNYPRMALVAIRALASDQISGSFSFETMAECSYIAKYNSSGTLTSVDAYDNPAWVVVDILTQPVFDNNLNIIRYDGIHPSRLDMAKFIEWADFCDELVPSEDSTYSGDTWKAMTTAEREADAGEKRITFNGGFDTSTNIWDAVMQVCQVGRAILVMNGTMITVAIDKAAEPVQMFTVGNIEVDSFKETFLPFEDRASELEINFINSENDYQRDTYSIFNPDIETDIPAASIDLFGLVKPSEVWRAGKYRLACNQYLIRMMEWTAAIDSIACQIGDVVNLQHDVPEWGSAGGRIMSATSTTVTLDKEVTIVDGLSYKILIRLSDDTFVEKDIINTSGTYTTLEVATSFTTTPSKYDMYAFGQTAKVVKPCRIVGITPSQDQTATITAIEYNASIYDVDYGIPAKPTYNYSAINPYPPVSNIMLDEILLKGKDGTLIDCIDVYYSIPPESAYSHVEVWVDGAYVGDSKTSPFRISNVTVGKVYQVACRTVNTLGAKARVSDSPFETITTLGKLATPSDVTGFTSTTEGEGIKLTWSHIEDADLWGYEIRLGSSWETGTTVVEGVTKNSYFWYPTATGPLTFWIKAIDTSGLCSTNATFTNVNITGSTIIGLNAQVVDNFVLLRWYGIRGTFNIDTYEIRKGKTFEGGEVIGNNTGTFATIFELESGTYTYWVRAKDTVGLYSDPVNVATVVNQPADYVINADDDDKFSGYKSNIIEERIIDYHLITEGTINVTNGSATVTGNDTSWQNDVTPGDTLQVVGDITKYTILEINNDGQITLSSNYTGTSGTMKGYVIEAFYSKRFYVDGDISESFATFCTNNGITTMQDFVEAGTPDYEYLMQPSLASAVYEKVRDYGASFGSSSVTATLEKTIETGSVTINPIISVSNTLSSLTGTMTFTKGSETITGSGTSFTAELATGDYIIAATSTTPYRIKSIESNTSLTLDWPFEEFTETAITGKTITSWTDYVGSWQIFATDFRFVKVKLEFSGAGQHAIELVNLNIRLDIKKKSISISDSIITASAGKLVKFTEAFSAITGIQVSAAYQTGDTINSRTPIYVFTNSYATTASECTTGQVNVATGQGSQFAANDWISVNLPTGVEVVQIASINGDQLSLATGTPLSAAPGIGYSIFHQSAIVYLYDKDGVLTTGNFSITVEGY